VSGEVVVSAECLTFLVIGDDPGVDLVVDGAATVALNVVTQGLTGGLVGNTYGVRVSATTSLDNVVITLADIAVIDEGF